MHRLFAALAAALLSSVATQAAPALWKVSDDDSAVWLFGSVHMLRADTDWRTQTLDKIISKADRVYFEADISAEAQMEIVPISIDLGFNRDGVLLSHQIGPALTDRVRAAAEEYDLPMPALLTMKPWLAATTLSGGPLLYSGYDPAHGVDMVLAEELPAERKGFLETGAEQLGILSGGTLEEQITMLEATLDTLDTANADVETMIAAWLDGDPERLGEAFDDQTQGYGTNMVDRIIDVRNHNWAEKIEIMLGDNEAALLVVGAAHLAGDVSVVKLLEGRGFSSERVQ